MQLVPLCGCAPLLHDSPTWHTCSLDFVEVLGYNRLEGFSPMPSVDQVVEVRVYEAAQVFWPTCVSDVGAVAPRRSRRTHMRTLRASLICPTPLRLLVLLYWLHCLLLLGCYCSRDLPLQKFHSAPLFKVLLSRLVLHCRHVRTDAQVLPLRTQAAAVVMCGLECDTKCIEFLATLPQRFLTGCIAAPAQVLFLQDPHPVLTTKRWVQPDQDLQVFAVRRQAHAQRMLCDMWCNCMQLCSVSVASRTASGRLTCPLQRHFSNRVRMLRRQLRRWHTLWALQRSLGWSGWR